MVGPPFDPALPKSLGNHLRHAGSKLHPKVNNSYVEIRDKKLKHIDFQRGEFLKFQVTDQWFLNFFVKHNQYVIFS